MADPISSHLLGRRLTRREVGALATGAGAAFLVARCGGDSASSATPTSPVITDSPQVARPPGWEDASHGKAARADYATVFPSDRINQIMITLAPQTWSAMLDDLTVHWGPRGGRPGQTGSDARPSGFPEENPMWGRATVSFSGRTWTQVGVRFKGSSSLQWAWREGSDRFPFKLRFDEFDNEYPATKNQRFFGFRELSFSSNSGDATQVRETIAYEVFRAAGLVASQASLCELLLDRGEGAKSLGVYTLVELVDDTVVTNGFSDTTGSLYKAEGPAATLGLGTISDIDGNFSAKSGKNPDHWDIKALYNALHAPERLTSPEAWRRGLDAVFDVDTFLTWLGASATLLHWDSYGQMPHNYYLYNDPARAKLTWITWDHNFVLGVSDVSGKSPARPGGSFDRAEIKDGWPLIRFLLDDPVYYDRYLGLLRTRVAPSFDADALTARCDALAALAQERPGQQGPPGQYLASVDALKDVIRRREAALAQFIA